ncbi:hypothetical protein AX15_006315 [Amanita polypyramis BW_CC]|nr:hypothetical protein AX15_006315 [Amanita polypyramis BW_CC]
MLMHREFSAWIVVDGKELPEYLVALDIEANRISCWIPGEEGQPFSVHWKDHGGKVDTCSYITLDGFTVPGRFLFREGTACREGVRTSRTAERPFIFQKVHEDITPTAQAAAAVGMITLRVKRITRVASQPANALQALPHAVLGKRKAGDLCIGFGEETPAFEQYSSTWSVMPYEKDDSPSKTPKTYVSFVFRYRTREFLEARGIIPESEKSNSRAPHRSPVRRISSLPLSMSSLAVPTPPESPENEMEPLQKRRKITWMYNEGPRHPPGSAADTRRTVSWKIITRKDIAPSLTVETVPLPGERGRWGDEM